MRLTFGQYRNCVGYYNAIANNKSIVVNAFMRSRCYDKLKTIQKSCCVVYLSVWERGTTFLLSCCIPLCFKRVVIYVLRQCLSGGRELPTRSVWNLWFHGKQSIALDDVIWEEVYCFILHIQQTFSLLTLNLTIQYTACGNSPPSVRLGWCGWLLARLRVELYSYKWKDGPPLSNREVDRQLIYFSLGRLLFAIAL